MGGQVFFCAYQDIDADDADPQRCHQDEDQEQPSLDGMSRIGDRSEQGLVLNTARGLAEISDIVFVGGTHVAVQPDEGMEEEECSLDTREDEDGSDPLLQLRCGRINIRRPDPSDGGGIGSEHHGRKHN